MSTTYAFYLCLWFCNVNFKKETKETGREIRKGNPAVRPCLRSAYTSGATYTQFPDSCAMHFVLRGAKCETISCGDRRCWQCCRTGLSKERPKNTKTCHILLGLILSTFRDFGGGGGFVVCCWRFKYFGLSHSVDWQMLTTPRGLTPHNTIEPGYNDIGLYDTSPIASDMLWYPLTLQRRSVYVLYKDSVRTAL
jgi:hypothetical protein